MGVVWSCCETLVPPLQEHAVKIRTRMHACSYCCVRNKDTQAIQISLWTQQTAGKKATHVPSGVLTRTLLNRISRKLSLIIALGLLLGLGLAATELATATSGDGSGATV